MPRTDPVALIALLVLVAWVPSVAAESDSEFHEREAKVQTQIEDMLDSIDNDLLDNAFELDAYRQAQAEDEARRNALDETRVVEFNIARGSLRDAVQQVSEQGWTGQYFFDPHPGLLSAERMSVEGFRGAFTVRAAIDRVLKGTGLTATLYRSSLGIRVYEPGGLPRDGVERAVLISFAGGRLDEEAEYLAQRTGTRFAVGRCADIRTAQLPNGKFTPFEAWTDLIRPICMPPRYTRAEYIESGFMLWFTALSNLAGARQIQFDIKAQQRRLVIADIARQSKVGINYLSNSTAEEQRIVGPIVGRMSFHRATYMAVLGARLYPRWMDDRTLSIEPFPIFPPDQLCGDVDVCGQIWMLPQTGEVQVTASRIPGALDDRATIRDQVSGSSTIVMDRGRIDELGVSTVPEALRYLTQTAFTRSAAHQLSGAQIAEGRGVGPAMVLIENKRTTASANAVRDSAFDLNTIPLAAIERIEFVPDDGSVVYGVDALGGIINIVLRRPKEGVGAEGRYGAARGGSIERRFTALARAPADQSDGAALIVEYSEVTNLLGHSRDRYNNQDYRRYDGGTDRRSTTSAPGNVRLPGRGNPLLGLPSINDEAGLDASDLSSTTNLTSLLRYQSVAPARRRFSVVGSVDTALGAAHLSGNAVYTRQQTGYTLTPNTVRGAVVASDHPQNKVGVPLLYFGLLTGLPSQEYETSSNLFRGDLSLAAEMLGWNVSLSAVDTHEDFSAVMMNVADSAAVARSLNTSDATEALSFLAPRPGAGREDFIARPVPESFMSEASQVHAVGERAVHLLPAGAMRLQFGAEWRRESVEFEDVDEDADRTLASAFLRVRAPLTTVLDVNVGTRYDSYSDGSAVTSSQYGFAWRPSAAIRFRADVGERYRPPSLFELHMMPLSIDMPVLDPKTGQTTPATIVTGGRRDLWPTTAKSMNFGVAVTSVGAWELNLDYWRVRIQDRIETLPLLVTIANEDYLPGKILRAPPAADGSLGRIQVIDIGWQNLGELYASGVDVRGSTMIDVGTGRLSAMLGITWNTEYRYRDLPEEISPLKNRVGIASEHGTIPKYRATAGATWEDSRWRFTASAIHSPSYHDAFSGIQNGFNVCSQTTVDVGLARRWGHNSLTVGATNVFDSSPDFSAVTSWGYDTSQGDLRGRVVYVEIKVGY